MHPRTFFRILAQIVRRPASLGRVIDVDQERRRAVADRYGLPNGLPTIDLLDLFPDFQETVSPYSFLDGTATPADIAVLRAFARSRPHCHYLEIGSWRGESLANVAQVAEVCVSLSLSPAEMKDRGFTDEFIRIHGFFADAQRYPNVSFIGHDSRTYDFQRLPHRFDLVFVDGDHSYDGVLSDTRNVFQILKDERAIIVWHDYGYSPETVRWEVLAAILDGCPVACRQHLYHISNTMCAAYLPSPPMARDCSFPSVPTKSFSIAISANRVDPTGLHRV
jgi:predicted O-methyltransferase YrrM